MDHVLRRVIAWAVVCFLASVAWVVPSHAQSQPTAGQASAQCQAYVANAQAHDSGANTWSCELDFVAGYNVYRAVYVTKATGAKTKTGNYWYFGGDPPAANPCGQGTSLKTNYGGKLLSGMKQCHAVPQPDGSSVQCGFSATPISPPMKNSYGNWQTYITYTEGGDVCSGDGAAGNSWTNQDGTSPSDPPPAVPVGPPTDNPPKLCGNVSCYDPKTGQYCAQGDSGTVCASGPPPGQSGGSCASGGSATVCAGSPQAPAPPPAKVPDPATQTQGTDNYTGADPRTGQLQNITVGTYSTGPGGTSNGATSTDTKPPAAPASSSSSGKDTTSASGGGDCNNPPFVEGNAALGMIALQTWKTRCAIEGDKADDSDKSIPGVDGVPDPAGAESPIHQSASWGADKLDATGFIGGNGVCPEFPTITIDYFNYTYTGPPPAWCDVIWVVGKFILIFGYVVAYRILMGK